MTARDEALDWVKGCLVLAMLGYHVSSLFIADVATRQFVKTQLLDFVSGSWIFITGLLVGSHYLARAESDYIPVAQRLIIRGLKLLILVLTINLLLGRLGVDWASPVSSLMQVITDRTIGGNLSDLSFEILIGIGSFLIVSPLFLWHRTTGKSLALILVFGMIIWTQTGNLLAGNLRMIACGAAGVACGLYLPGEGLNRLFNGTRRRAISWCIVLLSYGLYWYMLIELGQGRRYLGPYIFGIISVLSLMYLSYDLFDWPSYIKRLMSLMAKYSLVCYMGQMALIWGLHFALSETPVLHTYWIGFSTALLLMLAGVYVLNELMRRSEWVRRAYGFVFL